MKITIRNNGKEKVVELETVQHLKDEFSPLRNPTNCCHQKELREVIKTLPSAELDLDNLIALLTHYRKKFGNMPVLNFHGKEGTFTWPSLMDIDVVKKYFTISGNTKDVFMNVHEEKALSWFTS